MLVFSIIIFGKIQTVGIRIKFIVNISESKRLINYYVFDVHLKIKRKDFSKVSLKSFFLLSMRSYCYYGN